MNVSREVTASNRVTASSGVIASTPSVTSRPRISLDSSAPQTLLGGSIAPTESSGTRWSKASARPEAAATARTPTASCQPEPCDRAPRARANRRSSTDTTAGGSGESRSRPTIVSPWATPTFGCTGAVAVSRSPASSFLIHRS